MNLATSKKELQRVNKLGFVPTHRTGDTGIGKTLEDLLHIKENNIPLHDIQGVAELKAYRKNAKSMLTLFTLEPLPKGGNRDRMLLDNFGYSKRDNGRSKELHSTLSCKRYNNQSLKLSVAGDKIRVQGRNKRLNIFSKPAFVSFLYVCRRRYEGNTNFFRRLFYKIKQSFFH